MIKIIKPNFRSDGIETDTNQDEVMLDNYITRTLGFNHVYDKSNNQFNFIAGDRSGRQYVIQDYGDLIFNGAYRVNTANSGTLIQANSDRVLLIITCGVGNGAILTLDDNRGYTFQTYIGAGCTLQLPQYTGKVISAGVIGVATSVGAIEYVRRDL